jgi:hypothetical protein
MIIRYASDMSSMYIRKLVIKIYNDNNSKVLINLITKCNSEDISKCLKVIKYSIHYNDLIMLLNLTDIYLYDSLKSLITVLCNNDIVRYTKELTNYQIYNIITLSYKKLNKDELLSLVNSCSLLYYKNKCIMFLRNKDIELDIKDVDSRLCFII